MQQRKQSVCRKTTLKQFWWVDEGSSLAIKVPPAPAAGGLKVPRGGSGGPFLLFDFVCFLICSFLFCFAFVFSLCLFPFVGGGGGAFFLFFFALVLPHSAEGVSSEARACSKQCTPVLLGRERDQYRSPHRIVSPVPEIRSDGLSRLQSWNRTYMS